MLFDLLVMMEHIWFMFWNLTQNNFVLRIYSIPIIPLLFLNYLLIFWCKNNVIFLDYSKKNMKKLKFLNLTCAHNSWFFFLLILGKYLKFTSTTQKPHNFLFIFINLLHRLLFLLFNWILNLISIKYRLSCIFIN
jgi:hypothetical protein